MPHRFALLGAGFIGSVHAANLAAHPGIDFRFVYDIDAARAEALASRHGAQATTDLAEAFDPAEIDAVYIASSTDTHAEHLRRAADAGIAVLCEKPIDLDLAAAVSTVEHVEASGITAMVDFNRRFDRDHAALREVVASGGVGDVELLQLTNRGPSVPPLSYIAVSGGQMRDQTVHFFDLACWIATAGAGDTTPVEVFAAGSALAEPRLVEHGDVDTSVVTMRLANGALVQIDSVRRTGYGYDERIEAMGSTGLVESRRQQSANVVRYGAEGLVGSPFHAGWFERVQPTYAAALGHFVGALDGEHPVGPSLRDGLRAQAIAEAATESLRTNRPQPVTLP
ncbi:Gfo/Idh/MocA family oxidoreductase [Curtobacterium sp. Leaf261]|uniref:Gfo/Idh/MocA family oxidoreductase n=1 Tax=Curtobacterium sp. Leaf261 TaxID=1736311 RepID=UPI0006FCB10B|nr:Gfo/Idh/MocA family oxidoreductase [Curtobacterium sp. Leaf261]KQO61297.1 oxidoreductase [Curtobacterium sp. Leaf261]